MNRDVRGAVARSRRAPAKGKNCSSTCATRDHKTYGECIRAKGLQLSPHVNESYSTGQRAWDRELDNYESAVRQGLEPESTKQWAIDKAVREADA